MSKTEAQKRADNTWSVKNTKVVGCKLYQEDAEAFHAYEAGQGTTTNALLRDYVARCLGRELLTGERRKKDGDSE